MVQSISPIGSFKGYSFSVWLEKNKDSVKAILMGMSALATYFSTQNIPQWLQIILTGIVPFLVRMGIDALDFRQSNVKLS